MITVVTRCSDEVLTARAGTAHTLKSSKSYHVDYHTAAARKARVPPPTPESLHDAAAVLFLCFLEVLTGWSVFQGEKAIELDLYNEFDHDGSGSLGRAELRKMLALVCAKAKTHLSTMAAARCAKGAAIWLTTSPRAGKGDVGEESEEHWARPAGAQRANEAPRCRRGWRGARVYL